MMTGKIVTFFKERSWRFSVSFTLILTALYIGTGAFTPAGIPGFILYNFLLTALLENILKSEFDIGIGRAATVILSSIGLIFAILLRMNMLLADNVLTLLVLAAAVVLITAIGLSAGSGKSKFMICLVSAGLLMTGLFFVLFAGSFTPDSYSYYDIAKTTFNDYGNTGTIRQYVIDSEYNCSFPYLFPLLVYLTDKMTGLGTYSGVLIGFYSILFSVLIINMIGKRITSSNVCGIVGSVLILASPFLLDEACTARAIPLSLLLLLTALLMFVMHFQNCEKKEDKPLLVVLTGMVLGLGMVTRFDNMAAVAYCALVFLVFSNRRIRDLLLYMAGVTVCILPWIIYSVKHFGKLWITDNSGTLFLVEATNPCRVIIGDSNTPTFFSDPGLWFAALPGKMITVLSACSRCSLASNMIFLVGIIVCIWIIVKKKASGKAAAYLGTVVLFYILKTCMYVLVGYPDERYHAETMIIVPFAVLLFIAKAKLDLHARPLVMLTVLLSAATFCLYAISIPDFVRKGTVISDGGLRKILCKVDQPKDYNVPYLERLKQPDIDRDKAVLFVGSGIEVGRWTDLKLYAGPVPANQDTVEYLLKKFPEIGYVFVEDRECDTEWLSAKYRSENVGYCRFFVLGEEK